MLRDYKIGQLVKSMGNLGSGIVSGQYGFVTKFSRDPNTQAVTEFVVDFGVETVNVTNVNLIDIVIRKRK